MKATGPFEVCKSQYLTHTDVHLRAFIGGKQSWRVITFHDGPFDLKDTVPLFAAAEDLYNALTQVLSFMPRTRVLIEAEFDRVAPDHKPAAMGLFDKAVEMGKAAITRADTPITDMPGELKTSDPTYTQLIFTFNEIRRIVGGEPREMGDESGVEFECVEDINRIIALLDKIRPEKLKKAMGRDILTDPERDGDERLRITDGQ